MPKPMGCDLKGCVFFLFMKNMNGLENSINLNLIRGQKIIQYGCEGYVETIQQINLKIFIVCVFYARPWSSFWGCISQNAKTPALMGLTFQCRETDNKPMRK